MLTVICVEVLFRVAHQALPIPLSPLLYTLAARSVELAVILSLAFGSCGIRARSIPREIMVGAGISLAFAALVMTTDLLSRLAVSGGILKLVLQRQQVPDPLLFLVTGCVVAPFVEELFFRGMFYSMLRERLPVAISVVVSALAFAGLHGFLNPVQVIGGLLFAAVFEWRRSIWAPYTVHAAANLGIWALPWVYPLW